MALKKTAQRTKRRIKKGDTVIVIAGKYKGKTGEVLNVLPSDKVRVMGVNIVKKHSRGNPMKQEQGGIIELEAPIHISNVAIYNHETNRADKVGYKTLEDGAKVRVYRSSGEVIDL